MSYSESKISVKREEYSFTDFSFPSEAVSNNQNYNNKNKNNDDDADDDDDDDDQINEKIDTLSIQNNVGQVLQSQPNVEIIKRQITGNVGFANLPKQWFRKSTRNGSNFNLLTVGKAGLGKTTLINSLFNQDFHSIENSNNNNNNNENDGTGDENNDNLVKIDTQNATIEENGVRLKLTVLETLGFGTNINNRDSWKPILDEIDHRFDQYLDHECRINRTSFEDMRIHACLYFIEPTGHCLTPMDLKFCSQIYPKCNLIPVISKSDIMSDEEILSFKNTIMKQFNLMGIQLFQPPVYKLGHEDAGHLANALYKTLPYAVVGSNDLVQDPKDPNKMIRGRQYPWGLVEVENSKHSDFPCLRDLLIRHYLEELRERTNNVLYERYRSNKLISLGIKQDNSVFKEFDPLERQAEEKKLHEVKLAKLESQMKSVFQQKVDEKEKKLQKSETELFIRHKEMKEKLLNQLKALEEKKRQLELSFSS